MSSWTSEIYQMSNEKNDNVQVFDTKWDEVLSAVTDRPNDSMPESRTRCESQNRKNWNNCCKSALKRRQLATRHLSVADWSWWSKEISCRTSGIHISKQEIETRTELQKELWARVVQKQKAKKMPNTTPREETPSVAPQKATVHEEKHAHSSMTRARKAKGRNDLVPLSPAGSLHRNSKGDGKGNERWRKCWRHPKLIGKSPSGKANRRPCTNVKKGSCQGRSSCD